ncbi:MAG: Ig-like domain-containing protein [candidate division Zixibacteria bacterium]|nr:Ig-like domain-containing protein [candidate division Zixibacteria bacterium]
MSKENFLIAIILTTCVMLGCTEENNITNNITGQDDAGVIAGRVISNGGVITVSVWLAEEIASTLADSEGYFAIRGLLPGVYEIHVRSSEGQFMKLFENVAEAGLVTNLGDIRLLNLVWPIVNVIPSDGSNSIPPLNYIYIISERKIVSPSLESVFSIKPNVVGTWDWWSYYDSSYTYRYLLSENLKLGQEYTTIIPQGLEFENSYFLTHEIKTTFNVESFMATNFGFGDRQSLVVTIDPENVDLTGMKINFNAELDQDSLNAAIEFGFPVQGIWLPYTYWYITGFNFISFSPVVLAPDSQYSLTIKGQSALGNGLQLAKDTTFIFRTNPLTISVSPSDGSTGVYERGNIVLDFNAKMDTSLAEQSFDLSSLAGSSVPGVFSWSAGNKLVFNPSIDLSRSEVYIIKSSTAAMTESGHYLEKEFKSYFVVR